MKKNVLINGNRIKNKSELYPYLERAFRLSNPIGHNLDALWDTLSHTKTLNKITIIHSNQLFN
ncbi:MAG: barstar family protein, partial [Erysipelotrichaceae bacterium]